MEDMETEVSWAPNIVDIWDNKRVRKELSDMLAADTYSNKDVIAYMKENIKDLLDIFVTEKEYSSVKVGELWSKIYDESAHKSGVIPAPEIAPISKEIFSIKMQIKWLNSHVYELESQANEVVDDIEYSELLTKCQDLRNALAKIIKTEK